MTDADRRPIRGSNGGGRPRLTDDEHPTGDERPDRGHAHDAFLAAEGWAQRGRVTHGDLRAGELLAYVRSHLAQMYSSERLTFGTAVDVVRLGPTRYRIDGAEVTGVDEAVRAVCDAIEASDEVQP